jgi:aspartyl protease family protein
MGQMNGDQIANLAYLGLLGAVIVGWFFMQNRNALGKTAQQAAVWALIFVGVIAAVGLWGDLRNSVAPQQSVMGGERIELPRQSDGHYYITLTVNGTPVDFVVDTGASQVVLTREDAKRVGIDVDALRFLGSANTANGRVPTAPVWLDSVRIGDISDSGVSAVVNGGDMDGSLLGMTYLGLFSRIEIEGGKLVLTR